MHGKKFCACGLDARRCKDAIAEVQALVEEHHLSRAAARQWIIEALKTDEHLTEAGSQIMGVTVLWLACTSELGELATDVAEEGGAMLAYKIAGQGKQANFRLVMGPIEHHPFAHLLAQHDDRVVH